MGQIYNNKGWRLSGTVLGKHLDEHTLVPAAVS